MPAVSVFLTFFTLSSRRSENKVGRSQKVYFHFKECSLNGKFRAAILELLTRVRIASDRPGKFDRLRAMSSLWCGIGDRLGAPSSRFIDSLTEKPLEYTLWR